MKKVKFLFGLLVILVAFNLNLSFNQNADLNKNSINIFKLQANAAGENGTTGPYHEWCQTCWTKYSQPGLYIQCPGGDENCYPMSCEYGYC